MEKAKTRKIKKWDEIHGEYEVEVTEDISGGPEEAAGAGPCVGLRIWWSRMIIALTV